MEKHEIIDQAVGAARSLPDLVSRLRQVDPTIADQLLAKPLLASRSPWGVALAFGVTWASAKLGLGWDADTCTLVGGLGAVAGAYVMRWFTSRPIAGIITKKEVA
jgi:hypothetical protein